MSTKNSYVSIEADMYFSITRLEQKTPEALQQLFQTNSSTIGLYSRIEYQRDQLKPALQRIEQNNADIAQWITFVQQSIESIAAVVNEVTTQNVQCQRKRVSLSAAGLEVTLDEQHAPGDHVQLVLELPTRARMMVIARVSDCENTKERQIPTKFDFEYIRESDQEMLIRHVHQVQIDELQQARRKQGPATA